MDNSLWTATGSPYWENDEKYGWNAAIDSITGQMEPAFAGGQGGKYNWLQVDFSVIIEVVTRT